MAISFKVLTEYPMPLFIMTPNNLDDVLSKRQASPEIIDGLHQALLHIKATIESQNASENLGQLLHQLGFKKKKFEKKWVYTVNASVNEGAHRFIFEKLTGEEGVFLVLRDVALHHHYGKALRWASLNSTTDNITEAWLHCTHYTTFACSDNGYDETELEQEQVLIHYGREYISLSDIQTSVLNQALFPQLLIGPPGSGKTLLIHAFFQEQVLQHCQNELMKSKVLKLLYLTKNTALIENLKHSWGAWQKQLFEGREINFEVSFKTIDDFHQEYIENYLSETKENIVSKLDYLEKLKRVLKQKKWKKIELSPERVLEEICHSAYILNSDINESFAGSNYKNLGVNQITIEKKWQEDVFKLFKNINLQLISSIPISTFDDEQRYDLVCVDESQQLTLQQLTNALVVAKNGRVLYCGDSNQRGEVRVPSMPLFIHHMRNQGCELYQTTLPSSHRLKPRTARLVSELVKLEGTLRGGLVDNTAYASLSSAHIEDSDDSVCWVNEYTSSYENLKNKASFAVLVLTQNDIENAKQLTGCETVIIADEVHGLEYDEIFVYVSHKAQNSFKLASQRMIEKGISPLTQLAEMTNQSPTKNAESKHEYAIFSKLFIALSRSLNRVHLYFEGSKKVLNASNTSAPNRPFLSWLKYQCHEQIELAVANSTPQEWLTFINKLIDTSDVAMINIAQNHLKSQFCLTQQMALNYVEAYPLTLSSISIEECLIWIDTQKTLSQPKIEPKELGGERECKTQIQNSKKIPSSDNTQEPKIVKKRNKSEYLIDLWNKYTDENITLLLASNKLENLLFLSPMPLGILQNNIDIGSTTPLCLFDAVLYDPKKFEIFINALRQIKNSSQKNYFENFITTFRKELKTKRDYNGKLASKIECLNGQGLNNIFTLILMFWEELTIELGSGRESEMLAPKDLQEEDGDGSYFVTCAINESRYLDVLLTHAASRLISGHDIAHALFYFFHFNVKTQYKKHTFFELWDDLQGLEIIEKWIDKMDGYPHMYDVAKILSQTETLDERRLLVGNKVLFNCVSTIFLNLPSSITIAEDLEKINDLLENSYVEKMIFEDLRYLIPLFDLAISPENVTYNEAYNILSEGDIDENLVARILDYSIPTFRLKLQSDDDQETQENTLHCLSDLFSLIQHHDIVDNYGVIEAILSFVHQQDKITEYILHILYFLSQTKENFDLFIEFNVPQLMLVLMTDRSTPNYETISWTTLTLMKINAESVCSNIDKQSLLEVSHLLQKPNQKYYADILVLIEHYNLQLFSKASEQKILLDNVYKALSYASEFREKMWCVKSICSMVDANFEQIPLEPALLEKLTSFISHNKYIPQEMADKINHFFEEKQDLNPPASFGNIQSMFPTSPINIGDTTNDVKGPIP